MTAKQYTIYNNSSVSRDNYGSRSTTKQLQGNVAKDGCRGAQQWRYRLHLMHIMEVSMVYSGLAVVSVFLLL